MTASETQRTIEAVWRMESARLIAGLTRILRDVGLAEDLAHDALLAALQQWPESGVPDNPGAWLMATARNRAIDQVRRDRVLETKLEEVAREDAARRAAAPDRDAAFDDEIGDDLLRLIFLACHPVLPTDARVALTLRLLGGLATTEIARAFLVPEATVAQRIVRAKKSLAEARATFETLRPEDIGTRLPSVLEVIYLVFNEGYSATSGDAWVRPELCEEAMRLGRVLAGLVPKEAEVHGLVALMELQASRLRARVGPDGAPVLLADQDRARWDRVLIGHGLAALDLAEKLSRPPGAYTLQAAIAACHARAPGTTDTDWRRIAALYEQLGTLVPSPVVQLNRSVAVGMASGPAAGLALLDAVAADPVLEGYHLLPAVRGDFLLKLGRAEEARSEFTRAASLTRNERERDLLLKRAAATEPA